MQTYLDVLDWAAHYHVGDLSGILGLLLSVLGFSATLWGVHRSRTAAEAAQAAAERARSQLLGFETSTRLARILSQLELVRRLQRAGEWATLIDHYTDLRMQALEVRERNPSLTPEQRAVLQGFVDLMRTLEEAAEDTMRGRGDGADMVVLTRTMVLQHEALARLLWAIEGGANVGAADG